ncbi:MAG: SMP-30/gluconolactonase/LRE family protein [Mycobacteriales bacterium]
MPIKRLGAERASQDACPRGSAPRWDGDRLVWVDQLAGRLYLGRWENAQIKTAEVVKVDRPLGAVAPAGDGWVAAVGRGFGQLAESGALTPLDEPEPETHRMNDGGCDPQGRFFGGSVAETMDAGRPARRSGLAWRSRRAGTLRRLDPDAGSTAVASGFGVPYGLGWSLNERVLYVNDAGAGVTYTFEYDPDAGEVGTRRTLVRPEAGAPAGLAVDGTGCLWSALRGGGVVHRYTPRGVLDTVVTLPVSQPTGCCFVGEVLVITTASAGLAAPGPDDGALFAVDVGVDGPVATPYRG